MRDLRIVLICLCVLVTLTVVPASAEPPAEPVVRAMTIYSPGTFDKEAQFDQQLRLQRWLERESVALGARRPLTVELDVEDLVALESREPMQRRFKVGVAKPLGAEIDFSKGAPAHGAVRSVGDRLVWTEKVRSEGAAALRLHFTGFFLPRGTKLYLYNARGEAYGPYTGSGPLGTGDFWSHTVSGSEVTVQLHRNRATAIAPRFKIAEVGHLGERFPVRMIQNPLAGGFEKAFCPNNEPCVVNASCANVGAASDARNAVARMLFQSGGFLYLCSGGLLADTAMSLTPYFLTANHCISKNNEAASLQTFFFYSVPCNGDCDPPGTASTLGSTIKSKGRTSDYTLLELSEPAPNNAAFLAWTNVPIANTNNAALHRISHPAGSPQAYSEHSVDTGATTCQSWPRGAWIYSRDVTGATEGGSSGSPVLNAAGEVVGQLSGACGFNVNDPCDSGANATVDGAFANYFDDVRPFLDPQGGPGCSDPGQACTQNSDCCSNKCKGKPGSKTCN